MANIRRLLVTILTMLGMILLNLLKVLVGAPDSNESMANIRRLLDTIMTIEGVILFNVLKVLVGAPGRNESIANIRRLSVTVLTMLGMIPLKALVDAPHSNESSLATVNPVTTIVVDAKEAEKHYETNDRFSAGTIDFCVPALHWNIGRELIVSSSQLDVLFPFGYPGKANHREAKLTVDNVLKSVAGLLLAKGFFSNQELFFEVLETIAQLSPMFFTGDTVLFAVTVNITR
ncbi:hypothetical protein KC343_g3472 [Hortaea werneckii]|nr:hypothetical protein KC352_g14395 [Hortaea werneckii]KAI7357123.1 hypothetical protein KC320_g1903 [Hortaea werneckii]KAI7565150.1 hypothetical protein KC317_g6564 [Hortaea werneckii]KAI7615239.1 hypothetical protein KC346_g6561 [Hortaea werneckii]KAI7632457.1 hypothetical protein KC343_g3472 [Hortaea werneckii]